MTSDGPREYNREYTKQLSDDTRLRLGYSHDRGTVTRFVVQLEYLADDDWQEVVRADHDGTDQAEHAHDVTRQGVHLDVYRSGDKYRTEEIFPPMPASQALTNAEEHISTHAEHYITRYKRWRRTDHETE